MNVQNIELTESGVAKFNLFFFEMAKDAVKIDAVMLDVLNVLESRAQNDESYVYELHSQFTISGRPELLILDAEDVSVEICEGEDE